MKFNEKITILRYWIGDNEKKIRLWALILLIATLSFGLGYLTNKKFNYAPIIIEKCANFVSE